MKNNLDESIEKLKRKIVGIIITNEKQ